MLALDMGLGKTISTGTAISDLISACIIKRCLIVAPLRVCNTVWRQELGKWGQTQHLKVSVATGSAQARRKALNAKADVYVINRENLVWLIDQCKGRWPYDAVVIDESSSFKSVGTKRFRKFKKISQLPKVMVLLTGTPSPNSLLDLWSQCYIMDGGAALSRTMTGFKQRFFTPDYWGHTWTPKPGTPEKVHERIKPLVLSMSADDYLDVPDRIDLVERVELPKKILDEYKKFEKELFLDFKDVEIEAMSAAVLANKLLQFSNGAIYDEERKWHQIHDKKLETLKEIVEENAGESILVAYNYKHDLARLKAWFPDAVEMDKTGSVIEQWNRGGEIQMLLTHPASCGHGLNLQRGGSLIVWFGLTWNLEYYQQMNARLHRQGQNKPVRVVHLVAGGTIDERVMAVLKHKDAVQADLLAALKG